MRDWKITLLVSLALVLIVSFSAVAGGLDATVDDLDPPDEYDQLLERYKEMAEIALRYRELYQEAEDDVKRLEGRVESLLQQIERQEELIEMQDELIDDLLSEGDGNFLLAAEYDYYPYKNEHEFKLSARYELPMEIPIF